MASSLVALRYLGPHDCVDVPYAGPLGYVVFTVARGDTVEVPHDLAHGRPADPDLDRGDPGTSGLLAFSESWELAAPAAPSKGRKAEATTPEEG